MDKRDVLKRVPGSGPGHSLALSRTHKIAVAGVAGLGAAAIAVSLVPDHSGGQHSAPVGYSAASQAHTSVTSQGAGADQKAQIADAKVKADKTNPEKDHGATSKGTDHTQRAVYSNNLDGWIRESLHIMKQHHIPGSYNGLYRNIMRESSGDPNAINNWDINAQKGIPSKGLLQVIPPTFSTYHVKGTSWNIYNPVANITAAANYAADRYGSMDNVNSAY
ncbi:transglycosylase SLT domain-containing protein [Streptomyces sp. TS71-3]|uniref:transglycosylase SLT domain-containing protein n=1 Tax=Streptomyces sp. TS71-3 TaxID=2733862 RepID=UPI001BB3244A|nr:transglycosylase SLT domain-containing protein [Streptomyces sp. TS71-3]